MVAEEASQVRAIERFIGRAIAQQKLENFDYQYTSLFEQSTRANPQRYGKARGGRVHGGYHFFRERR